MIDVLTLTMNPALDVYTTINRVEPGHKMRCASAIKHPGGGGINVARVLHRLGTSCLAVYPAGGATGERHHRMLSAEKVRSHVVPIAEEMRENFSVHEESSDEDYRFVLPGARLTPTEYEACLDYVAQQLPRQFLVISGGLAPGVPDDFFARIAQLAHAKNLRVVLDSNGPALAAALQAGVYLFKPSLRELEQISGSPLPDTASILAAARQLTQRQQAQVVAVSLGKEGALLVTQDAAWRAQSVSVTVRSTIGAGDSFTAGMVWALTQGQDLVQAFASAMASAAAALLSDGTSLSQADDMRQLLPRVQVHAV